MPLLTWVLYILIGYLAGRSNVFSKNILKLLIPLEIFVFAPLFILDILIHILEIALPIWVDKCISEAAGCMVPLAMLLIGFSIYYLKK